MTVAELAAAAVTPIPPGRGRWRFTLHQRPYDITTGLAQRTGIGELIRARSRRLEQTFNAPAKLSFTIDGRSQAAAQIQELQQDVIGWRWNEYRGGDEIMFRGCITTAEDQITEQAHVVNFQCVDYLGMMARRYVLNPTGIVFTQVDQDTIVNSLLTQAQTPTTSSGTSFGPATFLNLMLERCNPDGSTRSSSGILRDRTYLGNQEILSAIDDLSKSVPVGSSSGTSFDYDVQAYVDQANWDYFRIFYPAQGVTRSDLALVYGVNVSTVTRTVSSSDYANYNRVLGNNQNSDTSVAQLYGEAWNADAMTGTLGAIGTWMMADNAADVSVQATLNDKARANLNYYGTLIPSYSLGLRRGTYRRGFPNMGDTVPLVIQSGRLNVNTTVRVVGITYAIGDDGSEDVGITIGRPAVTLAQYLAGAQKDINALARR